MSRRTGSKLPSAMDYTKTVAVGVRRSRFLVIQKGNFYETH